MSRSTRFLAPVIAFALSGIAHAGPDDAIPYPDAPGYYRPSRSKRLPEARGARSERDLSMATYDDPNVGLALEAVGGLLLLDSSRGGWVDPRLGLGVRGTWEIGRRSEDVSLREKLFADVTWTTGASHDGTSLISTDTAYHFITLAPAYEVPFWDDSPFGAYLQLGAGIAYESSTLHDGPNPDVHQSGIKPVLQYGIGIRGRPLLGSGNLRISFRIEATRFRRGYMDDTFLGGSVGLDI